jgi:hypothetical protein
MDFSVGPLLAYSLGPLDIIAQGGLTGLILRAPPAPDLGAEHTRFQLGPLVLVGVGVAL